MIIHALYAEMVRQAYTVSFLHARALEASTRNTTRKFICARSFQHKHYLEEPINRKIMVSMYIFKTLYVDNKLFSQ
jgi:hypothetical protein